MVLIYIIRDSQDEPVLSIEANKLIYLVHAHSTSKYVIINHNPTITLYSIKYTQIYTNIHSYTVEACITRQAARLHRL